MLRLFSRPTPLLLVLAVFTVIPVLTALTGVAFGAGLVWGLKAFSLLLSVKPQRTPAVAITRSVFGLAPILAVAKASGAIRRCDIATHRAWVIHRTTPTTSRGFA